MFCSRSDVFTYGGSYGDTETQYMDKESIYKYIDYLIICRRELTSISPN